MPNTKHYPAGSPKGGQFMPKDENVAETAEVEVPKFRKSGAPRKPKGLTFVEGFSLDDLFNTLEDLNQSMNVGNLTTAQEIEDNVEKFFSKNVIEHIDSLDGKSSGCAKWQFHPKSNSYVSLNLYTCVFGKYRYPDNHANFLTQEEYNQKASDYMNYERIYRGFTSTGDKMKNILTSYCTADINNLDIYGNGVFGTNVYTTTDRGYAHSYAGSYGTLVYGLVDKNARYINSSNLNRIMNNINYDNLKAKVSTHLRNNGLSNERADEISRHFASALRSDQSLVAILLGYDYQISDGHQRNILNLKKWYIRKDF